MPQDHAPFDAPERFRRFFETAPDMLCFADLSGFLRQVNPSWTRVLGWTPEELCGRPYLDFVHPDDIAATIAAGRALERGETVLRFTNRYSMKAGGWRRLEWCSIVLEEDGLIYATVRDVTDAHRAALHGAEIEAVSGVGSWELDTETGAGYWSPKTFEIHEVEPAETPPLERGLSFYPPEARAKLDPALKRLTEAGAPYDLELPFVTAKGRSLWVRTTGAAQICNGRVIRVYGTFQDITDAKRAERRLEDIILGADAGTWEWNVQTGETRFNERWAAIIGYTLDELSPTTIDTWMRFAHPDDLAASKKRLEAMFSGAAPQYQCEARMRHRDGHWVWVLDLGRVATRTPDGKPEWISGTHLDITERKAQEAALEESRLAAEAANEAKSAFLANMSHEIRTPLNGVLGMAEVLEQTLTDPEHLRMTGVIRESGAFLLGVVNDVLDLSKIEAGRMELDIAPFDPAELGARIETAFTLKADQKGVGFSATGGEGPARAGDRQRILQILHNLVGNAVKFTETGAVSVRIENAAGAPLRLIVADTGIGMTAEQVGKVFDAFTQADASTTRRFGGSGLGLAIVRRFVEFMGGEIAVESAPGEGSTITVTLPLEAAAPEGGADAPAAPGDEEALPPLRVLAAEDNEINRIVLSAMLAQIGQSAVLVENGALALDALEAAPADLLLFDVSMPVMDGVEAIREVRAREAAAGAPRKPAVAVTANAMTHQIESFLAAGFDAHAAKPLDAHSLETAIRTALAGARAPNAAPAPAGAA